MTEVFLLPDLGEGLTSAEIVRWLVDVGDTVTIDQPVVEVETAKSVVELPSPHAGVVTARHGAPGDELPVGAELLRFWIAADAAPAPGPAAGASGPDPADEATSGPVLVGYGTMPVVPGGTPPARGAGGAGDPVPPGGVSSSAPRAPTGAGGAIPSASGAVAVVSPLVRRLAREVGVDLRSVTGTGPGGLIMRADVLNASPHPVRGEAAPAGGLAAPPPAPPPAASATTSADGGGARAVSAELAGHVTGRTAASRPATAVGPGGTPALAAGPADPAARAGRADGGEDVVEMRGVARVMAERVAASRRDVADATCWVEADATGLVEARRAAGVPVTALLARICVAGLARHPQLNASVDMAARRIIRHGAVHLGFAAATERGLLVPVVRDAHAMDTGRLAAELRRLTEGARAGTLAPAEVTGSTFTLNNYGVFGIDGSTPIINAPEVGMLGVGRIVEKPWAHAGRLALRQVVQLSLTFDHRACDGAVAGGFLRFVADRVEQPLALLGDL